MGYFSHMCLLLPYWPLFSSHIKLFNHFDHFYQFVILIKPYSHMLMIQYLIVFAQMYIYLFVCIYLYLAIFILIYPYSHLFCHIYSHLVIDLSCFDQIVLYVLWMIQIWPYLTIKGHTWPEFGLLVGFQKHRINIKTNIFSWNVEYYTINAWNNSLMPLY